MHQFFIKFILIQNPAHPLHLRIADFDSFFQFQCTLTLLLQFMFQPLLFCYVVFL